MKVLDMVKLADANKNNTSSILCARDALYQYEVGDKENARFWALRSLMHSVGVFHKDYIEASR